MLWKLIQDIFKNNLQQFIVCSNQFSKICKYNGTGQSSTSSIFKHLEVKWSKASWENLWISCFKINNWWMYCLDICTLLWHVMGFFILFPRSECYFNPQIHKMGPWGPKHHFSQSVSIQKYVKAQIPCVPLFSCQKAYITSFQNSQEIVNFVTI